MRRALFWALGLSLLPLWVHDQTSLSLIAQVCMMAVFALSYNILLGESGLLSFGHAAYSGMGGYAVIHAMRAVGEGRLNVPISLLPLLGGLTGLTLACVIGYPTVRRAGTTFAMITFGIGESLFAAALMFPDFFGGEAGISASRAVGQPLLGIPGWTLAPELQVVYWIIAWTLLAVAAMAWLRQTPLVRIANAVRDNPLRATFIGFDPQRVRWMMSMFAGFFAGIAGGMSVVYFEIVTAENVGPMKSAAVMIATYIGGCASFAGPILGAAVYVLFSVALSAYTAAWQFYMGLLFLWVVLFARGGLIEILRGEETPSGGWCARLQSGTAALATLLGGSALIELAYRLTATSLPPRSAPISALLDPQQPLRWIGAVTLLTIGIAALVAQHRRRRATR